MGIPPVYRGRVDSMRVDFSGKCAVSAPHACVGVSGEDLQQATVSRRVPNWSDRSKARRAQLVSICGLNSTFSVDGDAVVGLSV